MRMAKAEIRRHAVKVRAVKKHAMKVHALMKVQAMDDPA